jgi:hypothetical protein
MEFLKSCSKSLRVENFSLNLKYKATKDGFELKKVGRTLKFYEKSLAVITTTEDRKLGFFTDSVKSISLDFARKEAKNFTSFIITYTQAEQKNTNLLALGCIKLKNDCNSNENNIASFENPITFQVKEIEIYDVTGTLENSSPIKMARETPQPTSKLEKKFTLLHSLIKQKMKL